MIIVITDHCNLKCPYCFAENFNQNSQYMKYEDFLNILEWGKKSGLDDIRLSGGEPTLHPEFDKFLEAMNNFINTAPQVEKDKVVEGTIFTNGINFKPYVTKLSHNNGVLINLNSPKILTKTEYKKIYSTLEEIANNDLILTTNDNDIYRFTPSCNIYTFDFNDYDYIWTILKDFGFKGLRMSITTPITNSKYQKNKDEYFKLMKSIFLKFVDKALSEDYQLDLDCSQIPICYFSNKELQKIKKATKNSYGQLTGCNNYITSILPDLTISGCYSEIYFENMLKKYNDFNSYDGIEWFVNEERQKRLSNNYYFKCQDCYLKNSNQCYAGCCSFDTSNIQME